MPPRDFEIKRPAGYSEEMRFSYMADWRATYISESLLGSVIVSASPDAFIS